MTAHTPGPWEKNYCTYTGSGWDIVSKETGLWTATVNADDLSDEEGKANANLIAAAPDLLEALEWMVSALRQHTNKKDEDSILDALADEFSGEFADNVQQASATIAKAKGEGQ